LPRHRDHNDLVGNLDPAQFMLTSGVSDAIVEVGLPYSRRYDPVEELGRIRQIFARQAAMPAGRTIAFNAHRSLRRG